MAKDALKAHRVKLESLKYKQLNISNSDTNASQLVDTYLKLAKQPGHFVSQIAMLYRLFYSLVSMSAHTETHTHIHKYICKLIIY